MKRKEKRTQDWGDVSVSLKGQHSGVVEGGVARTGEARKRTDLDVAVLKSHIYWCEIHAREGFWGGALGYKQKEFSG